MILDMQPTTVWGLTCETVSILSSRSMMEMGLHRSPNPSAVYDCFWAAACRLPWRGSQSIRIEHYDVTHFKAHGQANSKGSQNVFLACSTDDTLMRAAVSAGLQLSPDITAMAEEAGTASCSTSTDLAV